MSLHRSVRPVPASVRQFQVVYLVLVLNFLIPAISYIASPEAAIATMDQLNRALGGGPWPSTEETHLWHMLAVGNVMTLAWMCGLLLVDLRRKFAVLPALVFLKGFSATYSGFIAAWHGIPAFWGVLLLDGTTTAAMLFFALRARRDLDDDGVPVWARLLLPRAETTAANLRRLAAGAFPAPGLWQVWLGTLYMAHRIVFRSATIGTSSDPIVGTRRARFFSWRAPRFPFVLAERAVFPLHLSGLGLDEDDLFGHLLGAHHDGAQFVYDLQLLSVHPGALERLRDAARHVVEADTPRTRYLRDLVVFEGYHARLLASVEEALRGFPEDSPDPDVSLRAWLRWCADRPATPAESFRSWLRGDWSFAPPRAVTLASPEV